MASTLVLGPIIFSDFEIPERLAIGGKQQLVVHSMPGGGRIVDAMGPDEAPIRWSGMFSGQSAAERIRMLERLRRSGTPQTLCWEAWRYSVIVSEFQAEITSAWWIPYRIQLCILPQAGVPSDDWLNAASAPALTIGPITAAALEGAIVTAGVGLLSADVNHALSSAGDLANLVTARAYGALSG